MARKVKAMPASKRGQKYPWEDWFDGNIWELTKGEDFDCTVDSMRQQTYQAASRLGLSATTRQEEDQLYIQIDERGD